MAKATFGGGCFWGVEEVFRTTDGVTATAAGYMGGDRANPTYEDVCSGKTGHAEVVQVTYDPDRIGYGELVDIFFANHNPTELNKQGPDVGTQYRSIIFVHDDGQRRIAEEKRANMDRSGHFRRPIVTKVEDAATFWPAEDYHQQYLAKRGMASCHI
ncbi:peptide-methionine (S)-S-oxide reductase MsrA [Yunchengibacter salinarum]|uniref:peptide-methionine (S)-S-oxide reductase MsrA n=1 Tax=Yunchengibacter salinarum TaxID=3133399 RepID=UPI0035B59CB3